MSFQLDSTRTILEMEAIKSALNMTVPQGIMATTMRLIILKHVENLFRALGNEQKHIYGLVALKQYWFRLDNYGNAIGDWVDIANFAGFTYRSIDNALNSPPVIKRNVIVNPTMKSLNVDNVEIRTMLRNRERRALVAENRIVRRVELLENASSSAGGGQETKDLKDKVTRLEATVVELTQGHQKMSSDVRDELNSLAKSSRSHVVIVHGAPYLGSPETDAVHVLSKIGKVDSFGQFRAFCRGRKAVNSAVTPVLAIVLTSELFALRAVELFIAFRKNFLAKQPNQRLPFKLEQDLPKSLAILSTHLNKVIGYWRKKGFGDIRKHGEKIVYFDDQGNRVGEIPQPRGDFPWKDPKIPSAVVGPSGEGRPSIFQQNQAMLSSGVASSSSRGVMRNRRGRTGSHISGANTTPRAPPLKINLIVSPNASTSHVGQSQGS